MPHDRESLIQLLADIVGLRPEQLPLPADIYEELGIDSLRALKIVAEVEARLGITFDDAVVADVRTVEQFLEMAEGALALRS